VWSLEIVRPLHFYFFDIPNRNFYENFSALPIDITGQSFILCHIKMSDFIFVIKVFKNQSIVQNDISALSLFEIKVAKSH
jgi:hypothetical protein